MGAATYPIDVRSSGVAYAVLVEHRHERANPPSRWTPPSAHLACWPSSRTSIRPRWRMASHENGIGPQPLPPFQSDAVLHYGQHVAMVVAETRKRTRRRR